MFVPILPIYKHTIVINMLYSKKKKKLLKVNLSNLTIFLGNNMYLVVHIHDMTT